MMCLVLVLAGCGSGGVSRSSSTVADRPGHHNPRPPGAPLRIKPAHMLPPDSAPWGGNVIGPGRNGWTALDHQTLTAVWAGGRGYGHGNEGLFIVLRTTGKRLHFVSVPSAGAVKVTHAPL